jgi:hypothetical protein
MTLCIWKYENTATLHKSDRARGATYPASIIKTVTRASYPCNYITPTQQAIAFLCAQQWLKSLWTIAE